MARYNAKESEKHWQAEWAARAALRRLYTQTGAHNALVELLRQDLEPKP